MCGHILFLYDNCMVHTISPSVTPYAINNNPPQLPKEIIQHDHKKPLDYRCVNYLISFT